MVKASSYLGLSGGFDGFCAYVDQLNGSLGIPKKLAGLGVRNPDIERIVTGALTDPSASSNPIKMTRNNTTELLLKIV